MAARVGAAGAMGGRTRSQSPEQDASVPAPSSWMFAAPPMTQAVRASRMAFSGRFASNAIEEAA